MQRDDDGAGVTASGLDVPLDNGAHGRGDRDSAFAVHRGHRKSVKGFPFAHAHPLWAGRKPSRSEKRLFSAVR
jgi:hypothetical protein